MEFRRVLFRSLPPPTPLNLIGWNAASNGLENVSPDAFVAATTAGVAHQYPVTAGQATLDVQNIVSPFGVGQLFYNGIFQNPAAYSVSSGVLTFTEALPVDGVVTIIAVFRSADQITDSDQLFYTRSEEHTSELQSLMRISSAVFCLKK